MAKHLFVISMFQNKVLVTQLKSTIQNRLKTECVIVICVRMGIVNV